MKKALTLCMLLAVRFSYSQTGNIGIGINTPQAQLHTTGSVRFDTLKSTGSGLVYVDEKGNLTRSVSFADANLTSYDIPVVCGSVESPVTVTGRPTAITSGSIKVKINILHPAVSDLAIYLISPAGEVLNLTYGNGGGNNLSNTVFWDSAASMLSSGTAPYTGTYKPTGYPQAYTSCYVPYTVVTTFGGFGGGTIIPNGVWKLRVLDAVVANPGKLINWSITFNGDTPVVPAFPSNYLLKASDNGSLVSSTVYDNGNVGIGTITPHAPLQFANSTATRKIVLSETTNSDAYFYGFGVNANVLRYQVDAPASDHVFFSGGLFGSSTELMRIKGTGNVGIGISTPTQKLDVAGAVNATALTTPATGAANMVAVAYGNVFSTATATSLPPINNSSNNCTLSHVLNSGVYEITFNGNNLPTTNFGELAINASLYGTAPGFITFTGSAGMLTIRTFNTVGVATDRGFSFSVFKP